MQGELLQVQGIHNLVAHEVLLLFRIIEIPSLALSDHS